MGNSKGASQQSECTTDTESNGLLNEATVVWCAALKDHSTQEVFSYRPNEIDEYLNKLSSYDVTYGHNIIDHDLPLLRKIYGYEYPGRVVDTLLISRLQQPDRALPHQCKDKRVGPHSVEAWSYRLGTFKKEHEDWSQFSEDMLERCVQDVHVQHLIRQALDEEAKGKDWETARRLTCKVFRILQMQEERGWHVDSTHLLNSISTLSRIIDDVDRELQPKLPMILDILESTNPVAEREEKGKYKYVSRPFKQDGTYSKQVIDWLDEVGDNVSVAGPFSRIEWRPVNLDSPQELKDYLLSLGWEPKEFTPTGQPSMSKDDPFDGVEGEEGQLLVKRVIARHRRSQLEGWVKATTPAGKIHPRVSGLAATGRARHSIVVNVPGSEAFFGKEMRQVFIAKPGWVMVGVDSKGNQARQIAARMGDEDYTYAVVNGDKEKGTDEHSVTQKRCGLSSRQIAKNSFYGIAFGARPKKVGKVIGADEREGERVFNLIHQGLPKLQSAIDRVVEVWKKTAKPGRTPWGSFALVNGTIKGLDGRPIYVPKESDCFVYQVQSDEAIQMQAGYCWAYEEMKRRGHEWDKDWAYLCWYHDEYVAECRPEIAEELMEVLMESIAWAGRHFKIPVPHEGEGIIGNNWYEIH